MQIKVKEADAPRPSLRLPPGERPHTAIVELGVLHSDELLVYVHREAMASMARHAQLGGALEVGGFLLGGYYYSRGQRYLDIDVAFPALEAKSEAISLTFDKVALKAFHKERERRFPSKLILGWYHTHPRHSVFLSPDDVFIHKSFFSQAHHVAIVVDPYQQHRVEQVGVFVWESTGLSQGYHPIVYEVDPA
ncbi:MAG: Mov34/MPN/PAD-1 family protein [Planctomycetes bacterium]|nr:Mov34/MPN/PAD-1 family protein [Planctomycetota bacterium]